MPNAEPHPRLWSETIAHYTRAVYAGPGHPLFTARAPSSRDVLNHGFVSIGTAEATNRDIPPEIARRVEVWVEDFRLAIELCSTGSWLAVLPDVVAKPLVQSKRLRRLGARKLPRLRAHALRRDPLEVPTVADVIVDALTGS
jgi:DNA-binding transcriptional LysR family regulator